MTGRRSRSREIAKRRRVAQRIASGERGLSPAQQALLEAVADPGVQVACVDDPNRPGWRISWIYRRTGAVRRQNVSALCDDMKLAGLIEMGQAMTSGDRPWVLTTNGRRMMAPLNSLTRREEIDYLADVGWGADDLPPLFDRCRDCGVGPDDYHLAQCCVAICTVHGQRLTCGCAS